MQGNELGGQGCRQEVMATSSGVAGDGGKRADPGCVLDIESTRLELYAQVLLDKDGEIPPHTGHRCLSLQHRLRSADSGL